MDEPDTARMLVSAVLRGLHCGALDEAEVRSASGLDRDGLGCGRLRCGRGPPGCGLALDHARRCHQHLGWAGWQLGDELSGGVRDVHHELRLLQRLRLNQA